MIALALALAAAQSAKGEIVTYGFPETDSCATWTQDRSKPGFHNQASEGWVLGFVSGLNAFGPNSGNVAPGTNASGLLGWVDNYCKANPLDPVTSAGFKLVQELKRRTP